MAKSIRAKSKLAAKAVKRKGEPQRVVDERNKRIAMRMAGKEPKPTSKKFVHAIPGFEEEQTVKAEEVEEMEVEEPAEKEKKAEEQVKVSTSGWKNSRHTGYKRAHKSKSGRFMKF